MNAGDPRFESWLTRETGIEASSLGVNAVARAVLERACITQRGGSAAGDDPADRGDAAIDAYWDLLNTSPDERQALIETLVVPETWFFRDREAFAALARLADARFLREPARALRILSVPCASGEEPYSISMTLFDAGIDPSRFGIDAIDISARAISRAQQAVYGRNSFRGAAIAFRDRHFNETPRGWRLNERVREPVRFMQASVFELPLDDDARYDFIFCRNVLIYFDRDAQDRAIRLLEARLADDGTLFVGPAETGMMMRHAMTPARIPFAFAFHRASTEPAVPAAGAVTSRPDQSGGTARGMETPAAHTLPPWPARRPAAGPAVLAAMPQPVSSRAFRPRSADAAEAGAQDPASAPLEDARRLADIGRFDEAKRIAHAYMLEHGPDASAFYLLGLIADAHRLRADAEDFYRKTLYLDPGHYEALTHLAMLLDAAGDTAGARQLMTRAQRALTRRNAAERLRATTPGGTHGTRRP